MDLIAECFVVTDSNNSLSCGTRKGSASLSPLRLTATALKARAIRIRGCECWVPSLTVRRLPTVLAAPGLARSELPEELLSLSSESPLQLELLDRGCQPTGGSRSIDSGSPRRG